MTDFYLPKRVLILGRTYPSYSMKYTETACTGGLEADTLRMVRIFPNPSRYLDEPFGAFQWVDFQLAEGNDGRPDSYKMDLRNFTVGKKVRAHSDRRHYLDHSPNFFRSVEAMKEASAADSGVSLGIIRPIEIGEPWLESKTKDERAEWDEKERDVMAQMPIPGIGRKPKKLDFIPVRFMVPYRCDDEACRGHEMGILTWTLHELYRKYRTEEAKVLDKMRAELDLSKRDVYFFVGTFRARTWQVGLLDSYSPPKTDQATLFK